MQSRHTFFPSHEVLSVLPAPSIRLICVFVNHVFSVSVCPLEEGPFLFKMVLSVAWSMLLDMSCVKAFTKVHTQYCFSFPLFRVSEAALHCTCVFLNPCPPKSAILMLTKSYSCCKSQLYTYIYFKELSMPFKNTKDKTVS